MTASHRMRQIRMIGEPHDRDEWLAGEVDGVEADLKAAVSGIQKNIKWGLGVLMGVLISTATTSITLLLTQFA